MDLQRRRMLMNSKTPIAALKPRLLSTKLRSVILFVTGLLVSIAAGAQADFEKGYQSFQSYHGSDFDTVNLANGNLVLNIPLLSYEQLGGLPPVTLSIRSNSTTFQSTPPLESGPADTNQHEVASGVIGAPWGQPHVLISPGGLFWKEERIVTNPKTSIGPEYLVRFVAIDDSGATHSLGGSIANSTAGYVPGIRYSVDGSGLMLQPGTTASGPVLVDRKGNTGGLVDPNGNAIAMKGSCATAAGSGDYFNPSLPSWEGYAHGTASATSITDSIGRSIPNPTYLHPIQNYSCLVDNDASYYPAATTPDKLYGTGGVCHAFPAGSTLTYQGPNSTDIPQYYAEAFSFPSQNGGKVSMTFCYAQIPVSASIPQVNGASLVGETINEKWWVLTSVTLPNQTFWQFGYDNYGQVQTVIMPTGAMVTYQYATRLACGNPPGQIPVVGTPVWPYSNLLSSRMVTQRSVFLNSTDTEPIEVWQYSNDIGSGWTGAPSAGNLGIASPGGANQGTVIVTDPLGDITTHTFTLIGGSTCGPYETKTQYYQGQSTLLKEVDTAYKSTGADFANPTNFSNYIAVGVFPSTVTTTLAASGSPLVSQDTYLYDSFGSYEDYKGTVHPFSFGQVLSSTESDWGSTAPLRSTFHTKLWQSNWKYYAANLIDLPCLETVYSGSYAGVTAANPQPKCTAPAVAANQMAQTSYSYDETAYSSCPNAAAGNATSVTRWLNLPSGSTSPVTHTYYCSSIPPVAGITIPSAVAGMPQGKQDALGNITGLQYDSKKLYLSKIVYPDGSSESPTYDDNTGLLLQNLDENGQATHYTFDPMRRLLSVTYPDGGSEHLTYVDTVGNLSVTFKKAITSATSLQKTALADGLGRLVQTQLIDANGTDYTDTSYDSLGRVASVSNPYRSMSEATYGVTTYTYDALSRKAIVSAPDRTTKQACFNGINTVGQTNCNANLAGSPSAWEDDADENGNDWQRSQNAIGQMTHAFEPNGVSQAPSMRTDYYYDVLNNLLSVNQWGGAVGSSIARAGRSFSYDSLSRLLTSVNPETGRSSYSYDLNGNVKTRVDVRGVTTTYQYDTLNRLLSKIYSGDVNGTPSSCYQYSASSASCIGGNANAIGRLTNAWTQGASISSCPASAPTTGFLTKRSILCYDPMGRIANEQQYTPANVASSTPYSPQYSYDLAGNLAYSTDGVTPVPATASAQLPSCSVSAPSWAATATILNFANCYDAAGRLQTLASNWAIVGTAQSLFSAPPSRGTPSYAAFGGLTNAAFGNAGIALNRTYDNRLRITGESDTASTGSTATPGSTAVTITGAEQSK